MTYLKCELTKRVLPVATFVLISFLLSGKLASARPQQTLATSQSGSSELKKVAPEHTEPVAVTTENDRYLSFLTKAKRSSGMYKFLENYDSTPLWLLANREFLNQAMNCISGRSQAAALLVGRSKRATAYLRKIKTKIKRDSFFDDFRRQIRTLFRHVDTKNAVVGNHFRFVILILFLRLFAILKSCQQSLKLKPPPPSSPRNQNSFDSIVELFPHSCHYQHPPHGDRQQFIHYARQLVDHYLGSFARIFGRNAACKSVLSQLDGERKRAKRSVRRHSHSHNHTHSNNSYTVSYTVKNKIPVTIERQKPFAYVDNSYQETLIANFLANSLPDLKFPPLVVEEPALEKAISTTTTQLYEMVDASPLPQPTATFQSLTTIVAAAASPPPPTPPVEWNIHSTTQLYPVPSIPTKPKPYKPATPSYLVKEPVSLSSHHHISNPTSSSHIITNVNWYQPTVNQYHPPSPSLGNWNHHHHLPNYPQYPSTNDDLYLHFPYPTVSSQTNITYIPGKLPNHEEPIFVEPIVVSSVDQLPTNYPIPMENASLSHHPITVITGGRPPEIVILEDTFQSEVTVGDDEEPAGTTATGDSTASVASDPPVGAAAGSSAVGPAAAAAAAAGLGALGAAAAAAGVAGVVGGAAGVGAGVAGLAASGGVGGAAAGGIDGEVAASGGVDLQVRPTDAIAYAPAGADEETGLDTVFTDISEFFVWILSFGYVRSILGAFYTLVFPHISFLLTSGFTVVAFLFPWLYPHVVIPLTSLLSSLAARDMDNG